MRPIDLSAVTWRKSSYSNQDGGECVEVADGHPTHIPVRDSKDPHGPHLTFTPTAWTTFLTALRDGEFTGPEQP